MKHLASKPKAPGFTLIELLTVIAIIGILAAMLLPALQIIKTRTRAANTRWQINDIVTGIQQYETSYDRFPVSSEAMKAAEDAGEDFTFGGPLKTPAGVQVAMQSSGATTVNNAEVMAILLDMETYGNGVATINRGHIKNTQRTAFVHPQIVSGTRPGLGSDGAYRDFWGNPFVITFDLNHDDRARDLFYKESNVSSDPTNPNAGLNGLIRRTIPSSTAVFESSNPVMVWSAGPDGLIDPNTAGLPGGKANKGANKDNILNWK